MSIDGRLTIHCGDALETLRTMASGSVDCIVTSPPYFGLRDYGTATWEGGDEGCDHVKPSGTTAGGPHSTITGGQNTDVHKTQFRDVCGKCGAKRIDQQIGLEQSPDEYVARLVEVFREARRVLADTAVMFLNVGDSYAQNEIWHRNMESATSGLDTTRGDWSAGVAQTGRKVRHGLKPKDLIGIPWLLAFALRADGWYLRSEIIWAKPNPMPESVTDRCTKAHEQVFMLSKAARYWYDAKAVAEPADSFGRQHSTGVQPPKVRALQDSGHHGKGGDLSINYERETRNRRSVWTIATQPCTESHYAVMPAALAEICIKAGCRKGGKVLDVFGGAGTTALAALRHGRKAVLIELSPDNCEMARRRIEREWRVPQRQEHVPIGGLFGDAA